MSAFTVPLCMELRINEYKYIGFGCPMSYYICTTHVGRLSLHSGVVINVFPSLKLNIHIKIYTKYACKRS